jgi:hypothetical protein
VEIEMQDGKATADIQQVIMNDWTGTDFQGSIQHPQA